MKLSIVIPDWKDPYSMDTIRDILKNSELGDQLEIIEVFDGHWPTFKLVTDPRVRYIHLGKNRGMRGAINAGIAIARGEFFMRLDEHCSFGKGFDKILTDSCKENEIMTARRYYLDPVNWQVMKDKGFVDYEDLTIQRVTETVRKFAGKPNRTKLKERKDIMIDETQAMQGSMWIANRRFWLKTCGELQTEGYGPLIQDSVEVTMKYWKVGGRLMVNKNTWFAHKHRSFSRTHNNGTSENPANCDQGYTYALEQWEEFYKTELLPKWQTK
jgi:hypothetical protein